MDMFDDLGPLPDEAPEDRPVVRVAPKRKRTRSRKLTAKEMRLRCLELASTGYYDSPAQTETRAEAYYNFVMYGPAPTTKRRKSPISKPPRKPLMIRRKKR